MCLILKSYDLYPHDESFYIVNAVNLLKGEKKSSGFSSCQPFRDFCLSVFLRFNGVSWASARLYWITIISTCQVLIYIVTYYLTNSTKIAFIPVFLTLFSLFPDNRIECEPYVIIFGHFADRLIVILLFVFINIFYQEKGFHTLIVLNSLMISLLLLFSLDIFFILLFGLVISVLYKNPKDIIWVLITLMLGIIIQDVYMRLKKGSLLKCIKDFLYGSKMGLGSKRLSLPYPRLNVLDKLCNNLKDNKIEIHQELFNQQFYLIVLGYFFMGLYFVYNIQNNPVKVLTPIFMIWLIGILLLPYFFHRPNYSHLSKVQPIFFILVSVFFIKAYNYSRFIKSVVLLTLLKLFL
ncbi:MAG: hypothetical protein V1872_12730, partial [bacterium]